MARLLDSVLTSLSIDQGVHGSILDSSVGYFSSRELIHVIYVLGVSVFQSPLPMFYRHLYVIGEAFVLC